MRCPKCKKDWSAEFGALCPRCCVDMVPEPARPLPECLDGIYSKRGGWEAYSMEEGYRKAPCDIRMKDGRESGPYWPNAGKFVPLDSSGTETHEREVVAVCYYV